MANKYTEEIADKIIKYWEPKLIGQALVAFGKDYPITSLNKDGENDKYKVMAATDTPHTDEIKVVLRKLNWFELMDKYDWVLGEEKKSGL